MPLDEDKYPPVSGRRRFVKGVVGSAALSSVGAGGAAALDTTTIEAGAGGGATQFVGIENTAGPAPRGMPIIPLTIDGGEISGVWPEYDEEADLAIARDFGGSGIDYSSAWFQYCGVQTYEGARPQADQDNLMRSAADPDFEWQNDVEGGAPLTVDMFDDYEEWGNGIGRPGVGKPASATWRSEGVDQNLTVQVLRSPEVSKMANGEGEYSELSDSLVTFIDAATEQDFMAWLNKCTHFCCVPGFKTQEASENYNAGDAVYCQCHQSVYRPFSPVLTNFVALPRPPQ